MLDSPGVPTSSPVRLERIIDWLRSHERLLLLLGLGFQMVVLVGMTASRAIPYWTGDTVLLRVIPVDPRDIFRGDYVILGYEFSQLPPGGVAGLAPPNSRQEAIEARGRTIYVSLVPEADGVHYRAETFSLTPPPSGKYLRGTIQMQGRNQLEFGIESYYVQEGQGRAYENAIRTRRLSAEVSIAPSGQAVLKGLRIE